MHEEELRYEMNESGKFIKRSGNFRKFIFPLTFKGNLGYQIKFPKFSRNFYSRSFLTSKEEDRSFLTSKEEDRSGKKSAGVHKHNHGKSWHENEVGDK